MGMHACTRAVAINRPRQGNSSNIDIGKARASRALVFAFARLGVWKRRRKGRMPGDCDDLVWSCLPVDADMLHDATYAFANDNCIDIYQSLCSISTDMDVSVVEDEEVLGTAPELLPGVLGRETGADSFLCSPRSAFPQCVTGIYALSEDDAPVHVTDTPAALSPVPHFRESTATSPMACVPGLHQKTHGVVCIPSHAQSGAGAEHVSRSTKHDLDEEAVICAHLPSLINDYRVKSTRNSELVSEILSGEASQCETSPRSQSSVGDTRPMPLARRLQ